jgi:hypothetical protein
MCVALRQEAHSVSFHKIFTIGSGFPEPTIRPRKNGMPITYNEAGMVKELRWAYHVAVAVQVGGTKLVFDPSLFERPVSEATWLSAQLDDGKRVVPLDPPGPVLDSYPYLPHVSWTAADRKWNNYKEFYPDP